MSVGYYGAASWTEYRIAKGERKERDRISETIKKRTRCVEIHSMSNGEVAERVVVVVAAETDQNDGDEEQPWLLYGGKPARKAV